MQKRRTVWRPSDIRDWEPPKRKRMPQPDPQALSPVDLDTLVRVRAGRDEWLTKLRWIADLLTESEMSRLRRALAEHRELSLPERSGRAAMIVSADATETQDPPPAESGPA